MGEIRWGQISVPYSDFNDIYFLDSKKGFITGNYGNAGILQTLDGGNTWSRPGNYPSGLNSTYSVNASPDKKKIIFAGGGDNYGEFLGYNGRNIVSTTDSGTTYTPLSRNSRVQLYDVTFVNDSTGYMGGETGVAYKTMDYGESWRPLQPVPAAGSFGSEVQKIVFVDSIHGFAASNMLIKTVDGGKSWIKITTPPNISFGAYIQMFFADTLNGIIQDSWSIFKTTDGGNTWSKTLTPRIFLRDLTVAPNGNCYTVGYGGDMYVSPDYGSTWSLFNLNSTNYLTSVYFYNSRMGFVGTADSIMYKTTDGGSSWTKIKVGIYYLQIRSFFFVSESDGYCIGNNNGGFSSIYETKDGGLTWTMVRQVGENLSRFSGGLHTFYTVGGNGLVLRSDEMIYPNLTAAMISIPLPA